MGEPFLPLLIFAFLAIVGFRMNRQKKLIDELIEILYMQNIINGFLIQGLHENAEDVVSEIETRLENANPT